MPLVLETQDLIFNHVAFHCLDQHGPRLLIHSALQVKTDPNASDCMTLKFLSVATFLTAMSR
jgi:hypothetical protein